MNDRHDPAGEDREADRIRLPWTRSNRPGPRVGVRPLQAFVRQEASSGLLVVAGRRLPAILRSFLLTLAIVDDVVSLVVIAAFYKGSLHLVPLLVTAALLLAMWGMFRLRLRTVPLYVAMGTVVLVAAMRS